MLVMTSIEAQKGFKDRSSIISIWVHRVQVSKCQMSGLKMFFLATVKHLGVCWKKWKFLWFGLIFQGALAACLVNLPKDAAEALAGEAQ